MKAVGRVVASQILRIAELAADVIGSRHAFPWSDASEPWRLSWASVGRPSFPMTGEPSRRPAVAHSAKFHKKPFGRETLQKLEIYRQYLRGWLPKFKGGSFRRIVIIDFFCGPGSDPEGRQGSPLIAIEEVERSFMESYGRGVSHVPVQIRLNDGDASKIAELNAHLAANTPRPEADLLITCQDFEVCFRESLDVLNSADHPCFAFVDQYGIQGMTPERFRMLVNAPKTDMLCFFASAVVKRFIRQPEIRDSLQIDPDLVSGVPMKDIHRFVCEHCFRERIPADTEYYVAPFSIMKGHNVYGLIFGSSSLRGLEAFLEVAWKADDVAGSANFNIDGEQVFRSDELPFPSGPTTKMQQFAESLLREIRNGRATNKTLYRFILENGFLPKHGTKILGEFQNDGRIDVTDISEDPPKPARRGSFYISWDRFTERQTKVRFSTRGGRECAPQG